MTTLRAEHVTLLGLCLTASLACNRHRSTVDDVGRTTGAMEPSAAENHSNVAKEAEVDLDAAPGKSIDAEAKLLATNTGVKIFVEVENAPSGAKGIHIHEKGDCSDIVGKSMGGHFAPEGHSHALPDEGQRHLGDLGNIEVGENGKGHLEITVAGANLNEGEVNSFLGKALVIHEGIDKGATEQPAGDSGTPMACGVVKKDD